MSFGTVCSGHDCESGACSLERDRAQKTVRKLSKIKNRFAVKSQISCSLRKIE